MKYYVHCDSYWGVKKERFPFNYIFKDEQSIELISIGITNLFSIVYYAVCKDFDVKQAWNEFQLLPDIDNGGLKKDYYLREGVLKTIWEKYKDKEPEAGKYSYKSLKKIIDKYGKSLDLIKREVLEDMLKDLFKNNSRVYTYDSSYNWVAFLNLYSDSFLKKQRIEYFNKHHVDVHQKLEYYNGNFIKRKKHNTLPKRFKEVNSYYEHPLFPEKLDNPNSLESADWIKKVDYFLRNV